MTGLPNAISPSNQLPTLVPKGDLFHQPSFAQIGSGYKVKFRTNTKGSDPLPQETQPHRLYRHFCTPTIGLLCLAEVGFCEQRLAISKANNDLCPSWYAADTVCSFFVMILSAPSGPQLEDLRAMLDNVASERDTALNDLRRAGGGDVGGAEDGAARAAAEEEAEGLRRECEELREKVRDWEQAAFSPCDLPRCLEVCDCRAS